jgi:lipoprotein-anchoring transpeptidase ErfK/SrfK
VRRAALALFLVCSGLAGVLAAVALAGPSGAGAAGTDTTGTTSTATTGTTTTSTTPPPAPPPSIPAGVSIAGMQVGGLSPEAAFVVVRTAFESPLLLTIGSTRLQPTPRALGAVAYIQGALVRARTARPGTRVPLVVRVRGEAVRAYVDRLVKRFNRPAVESQLVLRGLRPFVTPHRVGRAVDRMAATRAIVRALKANDRFPIDLPARDVQPKVTRDSFGPVVVIRRGANQLYLYDGMKLRRTFRVATGSARYPTPLGRFSIVVKWRDPWWYPPDSDWARGQSPIPPGPGNPLGTRWMGISAPGVGIHGTPDPGSIGYSVSHGCIRMQIPEAEWLFQQVEIGTTVFIVSA